ncbi:MAG: hypothetical protein ACYC9O_17265, partial [Candidatus Latescibacterota bacterium]
MKRREFGAGMAMFTGLLLDTCPVIAQTERKQSLVAPGAKLEKLPEGFGFAEGPVPDDRGNVLFVDYPKNRINQWSVDNKLSVFMENVSGPVGMDIDGAGNIIVAST